MDFINQAKGGGLSTSSRCPLRGNKVTQDYGLNLILKEGGYVSLASYRGPPPVDVDLGCAHVAGLPRVFQPAMHGAALSSGRLVVSRSPGYRLELLDASGRLVGLVRRVIAPQPASARLAARELGNESQTFPGDGGRPCEVSVKKVVEARGFADVVPAVRGIVATPDGGWWVERGVGPSDRRYDVFSPEGAYVGTLSKVTPRPALFLDDDVFVAIQRDDLDRVLLRAYRIKR